MQRTDFGEHRTKKIVHRANGQDTHGDHDHCFQMGLLNEQANGDRNPDQRRAENGNQRTQTRQDTQGVPTRNAKAKIGHRRDQPLHRTGQTNADHQPTASFQKSSSQSSHVFLRQRTVSHCPGPELHAVQQKRVGGNQEDQNANDELQTTTR